MGLRSVCVACHLRSKLWSICLLLGIWRDRSSIFFGMGLELPGLGELSASVWQLGGKESNGIDFWSLSIRLPPVDLLAHMED